MSVTAVRDAVLFTGAVPDAYTTDGTFDARFGASAADTVLVFIKYLKGTGTGLTFKIELYDQIGVKHKLGVDSGAGAWSAQADQTMAADGNIVVTVTDPGFGLHISVKDTGGAHGTSTITVSAVGVGARG